MASCKPESVNYANLTLDNFKQVLNQIIRDRSEQGYFSVVVQVPHQILNNVETYYYQQAYRTMILENRADYVVLQINWV